ncbi:restriction endonuclease subunit S [uncultured Desulfovibrio sp.]|uniref:restriction endonuclease subunit S n=1 Tax=uncultured Desulfovibrio sp. TaxID=167968 RepID=UPI0026042F8B|nr:restriction endonuclease subunit S [uncultured Desulfovibrio sp.]
MARPRKNADASRASLLPESAPLPEIPVREQPYPLPEGWKWVRLGDVYTINPKNEINDSTLVSFVPMEKISPGMTGVFTFETRNWEKVKRGYTHFADGDVAFAKISPCFENRKSMIVHGLENGYGAGTTELIILRQPNILQKYTFFIISTDDFIQKGVQTYSGTVGQQRISIDFVRNYPIPLPPREEQERIVGHIESLFARLDEARQKAEAVRDSVALRRAAILHKAFTGELTAKWREEQGISKESWEKKDFAHIITNIEAGKNVRCEERPPRENEAGIIKVSAVTWGFFNEMESKTCPDPSLYNENIQIKKGDFLFSRANTLQLVGNCVIVENITKKLMLSDKILRFSLDECTLKNYLLFFSLSDQYRSQIENAASGNQDGMRNISQKKLLGLTIPLPTLPEQREIVRLLDDLLGGERRIGEAADAVVAHIERMKKAILARAFRGELGRADRPSRA